MYHRTNGRRGLFPRPSQTNFYLRRPNLTTAVKPQPKTCGHDRAVVRNVVEPAGPAAYVCRNCYADLRAIEVRAIAGAAVRAALNSLFRRPRPRFNRAGGALEGVAYA